MIIADLIGYAAGAVIAIATLPQLIKTIRSGQSGDIDPKTPALFAIGSLLFVVYGTAIQAWPIVASNTIAFLINTLLLIQVNQLRGKD